MEAQFSHFCHIHFTFFSSSFRFGAVLAETEKKFVNSNEKKKTVEITICDEFESFFYTVSASVHDSTRSRDTTLTPCSK